MIRKNSILKRGISLFLCCLMIFSLLSNVVVSVYASNNSGQPGQSGQSSQSTAGSFIDFYQDGSAAEVSMDAMTNQDYYVMALYMSNWFKPGETTLADLLMDGSAPSEFFTEFSSSVNKKDDATLMAVVQSLATDFANAIDSGTCTLVDKTGKAVTGVDFLYSMMSTVDTNGIIESNKMWRKASDDKEVEETEDKTPTQWQLKSDYSKLYYGSNSNITFDFSLPAYKAAIQTIFSYRPELFLSNNGIVGLERLYVDAIGNIWGLTKIDDPSRSNNSNYNPDLSTTAGCVGSNYDKVYLILPACLNPSAFSVNVKASSLEAAKFPIINRFAMSAIVKADDLNPSGSYNENMVPIYNLLSNTTGTVTNRLLNIFAIHSLSGFLFDTGNISETSSNTLGTWSIENRRENLANFIYNPNSIGMEIGNTNNIGTFGSNAGVVVSVNAYALEPYAENHSSNVKKENGNMSFDISGDWSKKKAFSFATAKMRVLKDGSMDTLSGKNQNTVQKLLALYMCTPTFLNFNNVSMSLYDDSFSSDGSSGNRLEDFAKTLLNKDLDLDDMNNSNVELGDTGLSALNGATLQGFSLFVNNYTFTLKNTDKNMDSTYIYFSGIDNSPNSKSLLWNLLETSRDGLDGNKDKALEIADNGKNSGLPLLDALFLHQGATYDTLKTYLAPDSFGTLGNPGGIDAIMAYNGVSDVASIKTLKKIPLTLSSLSWQLNLVPQGLTNLGSGLADVALSPTLGYDDDSIRRVISGASYTIANDGTWFIKDDTVYNGLILTKTSYTALCDYLLALYGYRILNPSSYFESQSGVTKKQDSFTTLFGTDVKTNSDYNLFFNTNYFQGMYLGYLVDTCGLKTIGTLSSNGGVKIDMGQFNSAGLLPRYDISAKGGSMSARSSNSGTGVEKSEDLSFEEKQKDLINRIYGLTNDSNNDYRNNLIKNIIEGFFLTVHRTITGTWGSKIGTISTGSSNTYDSLAGFIYTPTLEELSFTATLMNNYIKIYVFCMLLLIFLLVLMVLLHMRTWQQGLLTLMFMSVGLLFPYVLISNTINIGNRVANNIYSDRFDFWAMSEHLQSEISLQGYDYLSVSDQWLLSANVTSDDTYNGQPGVKVRWMSPKKVDVFNNLYSDANLSEAFVTNTQIFKWLFSSLIYDSEFEDANVNASYVYRPYNSLALEAKSYYAWGQALMKTPEYSQSDIPVTLVDGTGAEDNSLNVKPAVAEFNNILVQDKTLAGSSIGLLAGVGRLHSGIYQLSTLSMLNYSVDKYAALEIVSQFDYKDDNKHKIEANQIGTWGLYSDSIKFIIDEYENEEYLRTNLTNPGIYSNLPQDSISHTAFDNADGGEIGTAIYLKNTESPFYYFYSVLKTRYSDNGEGFKNALLDKDIFKVSNEVNNRDLKKTFIMNKSVSGMYRDFLDLEGLFEFVIPQLKAGNDYVKDWQSIHGTEIETYAFEYEIDDTTGEVVEDSEGVNSNGDNLLKDATDKEVQDYKDAVKRKNAMNRIWNMYCPWVDALYDMDGVVGQKVSVGGRNLVIDDTLDPSAYLVKGRPMIFSEADMAVKGYSYKDLTHVERRLQAVTEKTYKDLMYLVNYYDMDDEVLLVAAAMYATFNFNSEFSQDKFLADSVVMYPQGFELKNFNYDAYMRLALLNSTGETVFATDDLYTRILAKTSLFTGILLLLCDVLACIAIPMIKFVILVGLLFLGILICIACVVNPPDKIFEAISKSVVLPTFLFMVLNITFAYVMSFIVGEGLTTYVGSKSINFATNDPTITLLVMSLLSMAYLVCAWKVIKFLIDAYKKFGMSTAIAAVGIVGAAVAHGAAGMAKKATGATVGALTAEKGNRLAGAFEGAHSGAGGVIDRRIRDKRMKGMLGGQGAGGSSMTESIDKKASTMGSDDIGSSKKPTFNSEYDKAKAEMEPKEGTGSTRVSRAVNQVNRLGHKATSRFKDVASGVGKVGFTAAHLPSVVGHKVSKYANKTLEDISNENKALKTASESMSNARFDSGVKYRQNAVSEQKYQKIASKTAAKAAAKEIKRTSKEYAKETKNVKYDRK